MNKRFGVAILCCLAFSLCCFGQKKAGAVYYQLKVYHLKDSSQSARVASFLGNQLIPALHRLKAGPVGLFYENDAKLGCNVYLFRPFSDFSSETSLNDKLQSDKTYAAALLAFERAPKDSLLYDRIETVLLQAFPGMPFIEKPVLDGTLSSRVYELRSYESATEEKGLNKIHMFNQGGEIPLFKRLDFHAVFYARVLAGAHMPNLMYMTVFKDRAAREAHWKNFGDDAQWKLLVARPEYQNNVSHIDDHFLKALPGSDL